MPFEFLMRSFYPPKRVAARFLTVWKEPASFAELRAFLERFFKETYAFWLEKEDPCSWLTQQGGESCPNSPWFEDCLPLGHLQLRNRLDILEKEIMPETDNIRAVEMLAGLIDFHDMTQLYFHLPEKLGTYQEKYPKPLTSQ